MTVEPLAARSPLAGWTLDVAGVQGRELPFRGQLSVRSRGAADPVAPSPADRVLRLGPDEWLVLTGDALADPAAFAASAATLREDGFAVIDVSAQRTAIELRGPAVRDLLARGCAIDLDPAVRPVGSCVETLLAQTGVILLVAAPDTVLLLVRMSFAAYLADWLVDAAADLG